MKILNRAVYSAFIEEALVSVTETRELMRGVQAIRKSNNRSNWK
jgi:hypothetical protein